MSIDLTLIINELIKNFDWSTFWTAIGSVATSCACIIALWQTKQSNSKKVIFKIDTTRSIDLNTNTYCDFVHSTVINSGNRDVKISDWNLCLMNNKRLTIFTNQTPLKPVQLPQMIHPEDTLNLYWSYDDLGKNVKELVKSGDLSKNQLLNFEIIDSTGKTYTSKMGVKAKIFIK